MSASGYCEHCGKWIERQMHEGKAHLRLRPFCCRKCADALRTTGRKAAQSIKRASPPPVIADGPGGKVHFPTVTSEDTADFKRHNINVGPALGRAARPDDARSYVPSTMGWVS